jgi:hypothetical protein
LGITTRTGLVKMAATVTAKGKAGWILRMTMITLHKPMPPPMVVGNAANGERLLIVTNFA